MRRFLSQQAMDFLRRFSSAGVNFLPIFRLLRSNSGVPLRFLALLMALGFVIPGQADSDRQPASAKLRVVVFGAHPDDPESGCGGLIALLTKGGHEVIAAYATCFRGDRKIGNEPEAVVRRREATSACQVLGAGGSLKSAFRIPPKVS